MVDSAALARELSAMKGRVGWKPVRTHGSMFILDVGKKSRKAGDVRDHGDWSLLVEQGRWSFVKGDACIVSSTSDSKAIDAAFAEIELGEIDEAAFNAITGTLTLQYCNSITLNINMRVDDQVGLDDQWLLYTPARGTWVANSAGVKLEPV